MGKTNKQLLAKVRLEILNGDALRLFQEEYFALDIIRILYEDIVDEKEKIQLLTILEEYGGLGLESSSVDQIITSLVDICKMYLPNIPKSSILSQIIITATSLVVQFNLVGFESHLCKLLVDLLLPLVKKVDDTNNLRLRGVACCCLEELEDFCPGLLKKHLTSILKTAQLESTFVYQDVVCLLSRIIHHTLINPNMLESGELKRTRKLSEELPSPEEKALLNLEIKQFVSLVMDNYIPFTPACLWTLIETIIVFAKSDWETPPSIFKSLAIQYMTSFESSIFLMVVYLKMQFSRLILLNTEEAVLHKRFVIATLHPAHSVTQRHIMLSCLAEYIEYNEIQQSKFSVMNSIPVVASKQIADLNPTAFDDISIQLKKTLILNKCLPAALDSDNSFLLNNLQTIQKLARYTDGSLPPSSLYCALFHFYCRHHTSKLGTNIQTLMLELVSSNPKFIPYTLDFLMQVDKDVPDSSIYLYLLAELQNMVTSKETLNMTEEQLYSYLDILKMTASDSRIKPLPTIRFLHISVLHSLMYGTLSWTLATAILGVCRNVLLHHSTRIIFSEIDSLLHLLMTNCNEVDIVDRATFYYSLLNGAADAKIREVLSSADLMMNRRQLSNIIRSPSTPSHPSLIVTLEKPYMKWERISIQPVWKNIETESEETMTDCEQINTEKAAFHKYLNLIASEDCAYLLTEYQLSVTPACMLDELRAITINIDADENFKRIPAIHIPNIKNTESKTIKLQFYSEKPFPGDHLTWSIFASVEKMTMYCCLESTSISFTDLMVPIPWEILGVSADKQKDLFTEIWEYVANSDTHSKPAIESIKILSVNQAGLKKLTKTVLLPYIVYTDDDLSQCAIFLPPRHHLLLKLKCIADQTAVSILTDFWQILPSVNTYLESLQEFL